MIVTTAAHLVCQPVAGKRVELIRQSANGPTHGHEAFVPSTQAGPKPLRPIVVQCDHIIRRSGLLKHSVSVYGLTRTTTRSSTPLGPITASFSFFREEYVSLVVLGPVDAFFYTQISTQSRLTRRFGCILCQSTKLETGSCFFR